jgi:hypothetical protein
MPEVDLSFFARNRLRRVALSEQSSKEVRVNTVENPSGMSGADQHDHFLV